MPTPIERALDTADRIIAANRHLEELSVTTIPAPPAGIVLKLAEQVREHMTQEAIDAGRRESEGTFAPLWRRLWLTAQAYELATDKADAREQLVVDSATLIELCGENVEDVLTAGAARKLYFALTGQVRVQPEHVVGLIEPQPERQPRERPVPCRRHGTTRTARGGTVQVMTWNTNGVCDGHQEYLQAN